MAKKGARGIIDKLPNRKYVTVNIPAATTTVAYTSWDTMMGAREGAGWLISRVDVMPQSLVTGWLVAANELRFQVCTGAQTALLNIDDDEVICTMNLVSVLNTNGAWVKQFPLTWLGPVLVASRELTCIIDGSTDGAPLQSIAMVFTIWYQWVQLGAREWVEIAEARGIA